MDWAMFKAEMQAATLIAFDRLMPQIGDETLYALCLQTTDDGWGIGPFANTREGLAVQIAELSRSIDLTPQDLRSMQWSADEWRHDRFGDDAFMAVNQQVMQAADDVSDADLSSHVARITDAMIGALEQLRMQHGEALDGVTMFVTKSDSDDAEALENLSSERLNPPDLHRAFLQRWDDSAK
jgi:Domain of unknown function (DUF4303)